MMKWVLARRPTRLVDPGCGSGRFSCEAVRQEPSIEILAIDVDPLATLVCRAALASLGAKHVRVTNSDFMNMQLPPDRSRTAFVGNPPYVRHHGLKAGQKQGAKRLASELGLHLSALAGLHVHFLLRAIQQAQTADIGCFVTSAEWLDVGYGQALRRVLLERTSQVCLHLVDPEAVTFADAMTTAVVICFEVGAGAKALGVRNVKSSNHLRDLDVGHLLVAKSRLAHASHWGSILRDDRRGDCRRKAMPLGEIVRVSRGAVTGANAFFLMSRNRAQSLGLLPYVIPVLSSASEVLEAKGTVRCDHTRELLLAPSRDINLNEPTHEALRKYLEQGERLHVPDRYICRHRNPWWYVGTQSPPIVATYMARQPPAFALNPDGMGIINVLHGLYPRFHLDPEHLDALVQYLNAHRSELQGSGRTYHGGLEKFEPREMEALRIAPPKWFNRAVQP